MDSCGALLACHSIDYQASKKLCLCKSYSIFLSIHGTEIFADNGQTANTTASQLMYRQDGLRPILLVVRGHAVQKVVLFPLPFLRHQ